VTLPASVTAYLALLAAVGLGRLMEMRLSRRHQRALEARGAKRAPEPGFVSMVALHAGVLVASALEVVLLRRPFTPAVGVPAALAFALANGLRWWVIATLGPHWNVQVVDSISGRLELGVVTGGPYRWIRHPNYVAVFVELATLPLIHDAWLTAGVGTALHVLVLRRRLALEEAVLAADPTYRQLMGRKPRFVPRLGASPAETAWPTS
jgi:methyltransferase